MEDQTPIIPDFSVDGADLLTPRDMAFPRVVIIQPTSTTPGSEDHIGEWRNTASGEYTKTLSFVLLGLRSQRLMFPATYEKDNKIECSSPDGVFPSPAIAGKIVRGVQIGGPCSECIFSQWGPEGPDGVAARPPCDGVFTYLCLDTESMSPFLLSLRGSSISEARRLNFSAKTFGSGMQHKATLARKVGARGSFYVPVFASSGRPSDEVLAIVASMRGSVAGVLSAPPADEDFQGQDQPQPAGHQAPARPMVTQQPSAGARPLSEIIGPALGEEDVPDTTTPPGGLPF